MRMLVVLICAAGLLACSQRDPAPPNADMAHSSPVLHAQPLELATEATRALPAPTADDPELSLERPSPSMPGATIGLPMTQERQSDMLIIGDGNQGGLAVNLGDGSYVMPNGELWLRNGKDFITPNGIAIDIGGGNKALPDGGMLLNMGPDEN